MIFLFDKDIAIKILSFLLGNPVRLNAPLPYPQFDRFKFKDFRSRLNWTALTFQNVTKAGSLDRKQLKMNKMATSNQFPSRAAVLGTSPHSFFFVLFTPFICFFFRVASFPWHPWLLATFVVASSHQFLHNRRSFTCHIMVNAGGFVAPYFVS